MTAEILTILSSEGESIVSKIRQNLSATGTNATEKTSKSLRFESKENGNILSLRVLAKPYFLVVETGRKPTPTYKPSRTFVAAIREWLEARNGDQGAAYAIARNIHKKGTRLYRAGGRKDIVSNVINQTLIDRISQDILSQFLRYYTVQTIKTFNDNGTQ